MKQGRTKYSCAKDNVGPGLLALVDRARPRPLAVIHSHSLEVISHQLSAIVQKARLMV